MKKTGKYCMLMLSIILTIGVSTVFSACDAKEDGTWMHCHDVQTHIMYIGIALILVSGVCLFINNKKAGIVLSLIQAVSGVMIMLLPGTLMSMCMMTTMHCWSVMKPFATVMGVLILVCSGYNLYFEIRKKD